MEKTVSFTVKMSRTAKENLKAVCETGGFKINKFIEKAVLHEIEREMHKEDLLVMEQHEKYGKKSAVDYVDFSKKLGLKVK